MAILTINGRQIEVNSPPGAMLLWVLRDELGMTGTRYGCGAGICGACTVHVDGVATRSCMTPIAVAEGSEITTIEGLATTAADGSVLLHPVQQAFVEHQTPQCGWCMSGQIMTAAAYLEAQPAASEDEIVDAMGANYCRCGCYVRILRAVSSAATQMAGAPAEVAA